MSENTQETTQETTQEVMFGGFTVRQFNALPKWQRAVYNAALEIVANIETMNEPQAIEQPSSLIRCCCYERIELATKTIKEWVWI